MLLTHALALFANQFFNATKSAYEHVHSVRIEPTKLILVGTRITYQATGDAGFGENRLSGVCDVTISMDTNTNTNTNVNTNVNSVLHGNCSLPRLR